jgi:hypothetical protein
MPSDLCSIVELRRYALRPNARETLIELFDREFVETQEAVGMSILGQFRDVDDQNAFVFAASATCAPARKASRRSTAGLGGRLTPRPRTRRWTASTTFCYSARSAGWTFRALRVRRTGAQ